MDFTFPFDHSAVEHLACNPPTDGQFSSPGTRQFYSNDFPYSHQNVVDAHSLTNIHGSYANNTVTTSDSTVCGSSRLNPTAFEKAEDSCPSFTTNRSSDNPAYLASFIPSLNDVSSAPVPPVPSCGITPASILPRPLEHTVHITNGEISHPDEEPVVEPSSRKLKHSGSSSTPNSSGDGPTSPLRAHRTARLSHTQVERRYREGLNRQFERLRSAVPTLPQSVEASAIGVAKPSKGMVLAAAIDYISQIEEERDSAIQEVHRLRDRVKIKHSKKR
jgi:hypothetical protein